MTRKKYIKQLMSYGMDRNSAVKSAEIALKYGSYEEAYKHILPRIKFTYGLKRLFDAEEPVTPDKQDELALQRCNCLGARAWRDKQSQISEACANIETLCADAADDVGMTPIECEEIIDILKKSARLIGKSKIFEMTVKTVGHGIVKLSGTSKGSISVKRTVGRTEELKANKRY